MNLTLVTGNKNKLIEWKRLLPDSYTLRSAEIELDEIQSLDPLTVVADKARRAYKILNEPVLVEDIAAGIDSLGGLPGTFIKFFIQVLGEDALRKLAKKENERASVSCVIAYFDGTSMITVKGGVDGTVVSARGENGFGFDKGFIPDGQTKTYGEMTHVEKDKLSHRSKAIKELVVNLGQI